MAKIISDVDGKSVDLNQGDSIKEASRTLGVPFSCEMGLCGTCSIEVTEGQDNLSGLSEQEVAFEKDKNNRLACQCKVNDGEIKIKF
jgi:ferredoxin